MIRINLLEETRVQVKAKPGIGLPSVQVAENVPMLILLGGIGIAVVAVAIWAMLLHNKSNQLDSAIRDARKEKERLEYVLKRNDELNAKREDLNRKIKVIEELKAKQDQPVQMMDHVSRNLADFVWLVELTFTGDLVTIRGTAQTPLAVSNFLGNLEESRYFINVAMGNVNNLPSGLTEFSLTMNFNPSGKPPEATVTSTTTGAPR